MSRDLLVAEVSLQVYRNTATVPTSPVTPSVNEVVTQQLTLENVTQDSFTLAADGEADLTLPHAPYDVMYVEVSSSIEVNVNTLGWRVLSPGGMLSVGSITNTVSLRNTQIPTGGSATIDVRVRFVAGKLP